MSSNRTGQVLHLALALFSEDFGIGLIYNERVEPTDKPFPILVGDEDTFDLAVDEGMNEVTYVFKLIVSTERIDGFLLEQKGLQIGKIFRPTEAGRRKIAFGKDRRKPKHRDEWFTKTIRLRSVRRLDRVSTQDLALADRRVRIKGHSSLPADVGLGVVQAGSRPRGGGSEFYHALERSGMELVGFSATRGEPEIVLELTDIANPDAVQDQPLEIDLDLGLAEDQGLLALTFDGEHMLLAGETDRTDDGRSLLRIDHIPDDIPDNRRSVGKALKLYFFKTFMLQKVNRLHWVWVEYRADGSVLRRPDGVKKKVAAASNILLLLHGIIGDTKGMAAALPVALDAQGTSVTDRFDLVLCYEYENVGTRIDDTARELKEDLRAVGLHEKDDKRLTLLVHSMGGLVSRWIIEQEQSSALIDHLFMCGTPNAGSPFGMIDTARNVTGVLTTLAMNVMPAFAPFGAGLLTVLERSRKLSVSLEQIEPDSDFLIEFNSSNDPAVRYSILAGDIRELTERSDGVIGTLTRKLGKGSLFDLLFSGQGHDLAASVESHRAVPDPRQPIALRVDVSYHHLNYFASEAGLSALASLDWGLTRIRSMGRGLGGGSRTCLTGECEIAR